MTNTATSVATSPAAPNDSPSGEPRGGFSWIQLGFGALLLVLACGFLFIRWRSAESTNDAYVAGHVHTVSARVAGTVAQVLIEDNQWVEAGQVLARLDARDFEVRQRLAQAQIAQANAQQAAADAQATQAEANIQSARSTLRKAELDFARNYELMHETPRGVSRQEFDAAQAARDAARAAVEGSMAQLAAARANRKATTASEETGHANLRDAELALSYLEIRAPASGRIGHKALEIGDHVNVGQGLLAVVSEDLWVVANFREVQLRRIKRGSLVKLSIDAFPGASFEGRVDSLSPATGSQFSLLPPDNATGNFTKVVQRVPVKILFNSEELAKVRGRVLPGLSVVAELVDDGTEPAKGPPVTAPAKADVVLPEAAANR